MIPTYFRPKLCIQAINSVLAQKYKNYELTVICHGKNDYTNYLKKKFKNKKIKYVYLNDKFLSIARNYAAQKATGEWLMFLDDDDLWSNNILSLFKKKILEKKNIDIIYSNFKTYDLKKKSFVKNSSLIDCKKNYQNLEEALQFSNYVSGGSAFAFRKERFFELGMFDENLGGCEDHDIWRRAAIKKYIFFYLNKKLVIYRKSNNNLSKNIKNQFKFESVHYDKTIKELPYYLSNKFYDIQCYYLIRFAIKAIISGNYTFFFKNFFQAKFFSKIFFLKNLLKFFFKRICKSFIWSSYKKKFNFSFLI